MKKKKVIYYLGSKENKELISNAVSLIGYDLIEKDDFKDKGIVIYSLNKDLSKYLSKLNKGPKNLIIISKGKKSYTNMNPNIYIYDPLTNYMFEYSFSNYLNKYLNKEEENQNKYMVNDFYQKEETIYVFYLKINENLNILNELSDKKYEIGMLDLKQIKIPGKYFLFITGTNFEIKWLKKNHEELENILIIVYRCENKIKKELKRLNFSVPMIFIKNFKKKFLN